MQFVEGKSSEAAEMQQKLKTFMVVVVGGVKTVENWRVSYHRAEKRR